ncbi:MAG TPA: LytR C-terminal domain-containing protein [Microthrixaceae bacterium]|nr:LytR C-terminal domain-containing protein [Microthrixaceae bacterium]HNK37932.1 LytR C-terminal domain-containing protein [Microthrixaceae bacterium]
MTATETDPVAEVAPVVRRRRSEAPSTGGRRGRQGRRSGRAGGDGSRTVWWQLASTAAFAVLIVALALLGYQASRLITGGGTDKVTDPAAPGYVAEVRPTPVDLVAVTTDDGVLAGVLIVSSAGAKTGGTVSALPATASAGPGEKGTFPLLLDDFAAGGLDQLRTSLGVGLTFGFTSAEQISARDLTTLAGLAGPITVNNVDNLIDAPDKATIRAGRTGETVRYRAGEVVLEPADVAGFLAFAGVGEAPDRQMLRHLTVWEQLLTALKGKDLSALAGEGSAEAGGGIGAVSDLLGDLGAGEVTYEPVPVAPQPIPGTYFTAMVPDAAALPTYVARVVPFPTSAVPGQRARVELLNGTTDKDAALLVAPKVVAAGGEITLLGNADSFDVTATQVHYPVPEAREAAEEIASALGVTATAAPASSGGVDVSVIVGSDRTS